MSAVETLLNECRAALAEGRKASVVEFNRLAVAVKGVEATRDRLAETQLLLQGAADAVARTLDNAQQLDTFHAFSDAHYSKVTTACHAAGYRQAVAALVSAKMEFDADMTAHRAAFLRLPVVALTGSVEHA